MTNKELAKLLQVSEATFSLIINNRPGISDKTRIRVINELQSMGYGSLLQSGKKVKETSEQSVNSQHLGFIVYKKHGQIVGDSPFFLLLLESIEQYVRKCGYQLVVRMISAQSDVDQQMEELNQAQLAGIILFATEMSEEDMTHFRSFPSPIVILDNDFTHIAYDSIMINNELGTYQAVKHLFDLGHRRIGYLQSSMAINSFVEREKGFHRALATLGLTLDPQHHIQLSYAEDQSYTEFSENIEYRNDWPTAFVSDDDTIVFGVIRALREKAPDLLNQLSFVGFNDRPICELSHPKITSIAVPKDTFGLITARTLIERVQQVRYATEQDFHKIAVGVHLVERESTRSFSLPS
ncbi:LacI family DNA-binding transcriptional regulator [Paenibacillus sp. WLX1005]|uniref:LacI family DNA-binding transcriptional regulator n=1 Tax=Paenibacillus sp. WLX1005 TaxID=3243766 RepID=UPI003984131B